MISYGHQSLTIFWCLMPRRLQTMLWSHKAQMYSLFRSTIRKIWVYQASRHHSIVIFSNTNIKISGDLGSLNIPLHKTWYLHERLIRIDRLKMKDFLHLSSFRPHLTRSFYSRSFRYQRQQNVNCSWSLHFSSRWDAFNIKTIQKERIAHSPGNSNALSLNT